VTEVNDGILFIAPEPPQECKLCGQLDETRPYGPNGEEICYECGLKDPQTTRAQMRAYMFGEERQEE
jgi:hypothetical protein